MTHEMQHPDSPTWCVHCGTFDMWCDTADCIVDREVRKFDMTRNWGAMFRSIFGTEVRHD